ncbi:PilX N-terminal domain-containing pilus assembly protein [Stenotrophomonas sp. PS02298]|uniref:pilus assembly PilX family protein n=1 Tax=Stenotrophomonas sp. PS02298 TaxID=2991424 RepID=UPI002499E7D9|nr:PilX N-terminal domain-containing pilus assembly protein [Stenotrophomonas sp. PS02298]
MKSKYGALGRGAQSGAALIVVLMMLVVITLLGLASMRGAIMQERMAANTIARGLAFQGAEAGLRQAEIVVRDGSVGFPSSGCSSGLCATPLPDADAPWAAADFWKNGAFREGAAVSTVNGAITPKFVIEDFGTSVNGGGASDCIDFSKTCIPTTEQSVFRITSYAATATGTEVIVQSLYRR